ncbi:MAG TPA: VOC family protein [Gemmatimonadaceae bacterium]
MTVATRTEANVERAVPFFWVRDIDASLRFYIDGLGFNKTIEWAPDGKVQWCWLELGTAPLMLQEFWRSGPRTNVPAEKPGVGVSICFMCKDAIALFKEFRSRGIDAKQPFVGNGLWVTEITDPDGYHLLFESPSDAPEESVYTE